MVVLLVAGLEGRLGRASPQLTCCQLSLQSMGSRCSRSSVLPCSAVDAVVALAAGLSGGSSKQLAYEAHHR